MDSDAIADRLMEAHPDVEPYETPWPLLEEWLSEVGVDPENDAHVTEVLNAWDARCG